MQDVDVGRWLRIPRTRLLARFVEADPDDDETDLYEWIVAFHICTRHVFTALGPSFTCPFAESGCPMRAMLDARPNRKIRFVRNQRRRCVVYTTVPLRRLIGRFMA